MADPSRDALLLWSFIGCVLSFLCIRLLGLIQPAHRFATPIFRRLFFVGDGNALYVMIALLVALALLFCLWFDGMRRQADRTATWVGTHPGITSLAAFCMLSLAARFIYRGHPLSMDEYAVWFQAQVFGKGHLTGEWPVQWLDQLLPRDFQNHFLVVSKETGAVASAYWPGFALLMAPFARLGVPWMANPAISALTLWVIGRSAPAFTGHASSGGWAILLMVANPVFWAMGISYYAMASILLFNLSFAWCLLSPTPARCLLAGFLGSIALTLHNPIPHILFALPWCLSIIRGPRRWSRVGWILCGYLPVTVLLGFGWHHVLQTLGNVQVGRTSGAKGTILEKLQTVLVLPTVRILEFRAAGLVKAWTWAFPGLFIAAIIGWNRFKPGSPIRLLGWSLICTFVGFLFVPFDQGHGWGFRYIHTAFAALPLLAIGLTCDRLGHASLPIPIQSIGILALSGLLVMVPWRLAEMGTFMDQHLSQVPEVEDAARRIIWIRRNEGFYAQDLVQNDPWLQRGPLRFESRGAQAELQFMAREFPGSIPLFQQGAGVVWESQEPFIKRADALKKGATP